MSEVLCAENITQRFGGLDALKNVTMHVKEGEIIGVIGPNGAGKTTLFNCITGMYRPTEGKACWEQISLVGGLMKSRPMALPVPFKIYDCFPK